MDPYSGTAASLLYVAGLSIVRIFLQTFLREHLQFVIYKHQTRQWKIEKINLTIEFLTKNICPIMICNISHK